MKTKTASKQVAGNKYQMPPHVELELKKAQEAGIRFPDDYKSPYTVETESTLGLNYFDFYWEDKERPDCDWEGSAKQPAYSIHFYDERFSGFYLNQKAAKEYRDKLNIRHFQCAALSQNKDFPVLL